MTALVIACVLFGGLSPATAWGVGRWNHYYVTYRSYVGPPYRAAFADAIRRINQIPVRFRLVPARPGRAADVRVFSPNRGPTGWGGVTNRTCVGRARCSSGTTGQPRTLLSAVTTLNAYWGARRGWADRVDIVTHELLHGMGLDHSGDPCALMYPGGIQFSRCQGSLPSGLLPCGPQWPEFDLLSAIYRRRDGDFAPGVCSAPRVGR